ncbi:uncharacterized protein KY384_004315 [Bacidia gigantensis]|uniref:uncharacterized protein n=1 Tax=Bacidia gigantensis TaxID=2732470 RepID=UPI001D03B644|nr:uncharacterized protein KY384_004315 [Bacidia gigantensis]KAG8530958.1 hypothetical protein KY384_004315 [Bacidia gigantensis]
MNGVGTRKYSTSTSNDARSAGAAPLRPTAKAMLNGYDGSKQPDHQRTRKNGQPGRSSEHVDINDPMTLHLLMETAIVDSQQYEVFSVEEVEELKKEVPRLASRIEATKRQLAIESKMRDAATSISKLDRGQGHNRTASTRGGEKSQEEIAAAHQKCENLAQELWQLERRQQEVQSRLLEHTAGVLQMTHKGYLEEQAPARQNGVESLPNGYIGLDFAGDDESFYRTLDLVLDESPAGADSDAFKEQTEAIQETERRLLEFNRQLQEAILQAGSAQSIPPPPNVASFDEANPTEALQKQISYMERSFGHMRSSQHKNAQSYQLSTQKAEQRLEELNTQLHGMVLRSSLSQNAEHPLPPSVTGRGTDQQINFLDGSLDALEQGIFQLKEDRQEKARSAEAYQGDSARLESALNNLWQGMSDGEKFSIDAFTSKVASLTMKISDLSNQKDILKRQIEQQREINAKSDGEKDATVASLSMEIEETKKKSRNEMDQLEGEMVRLQTEVTVARAELDGAYGTRAQRAAEVAQHPALLQEIAELQHELEATKEKTGEIEHWQQQVQTLRKELSETITEYEVMTKSSIQFEKERESLESSADRLRDHCEELETQLSEERVNKLGVRSPGTPGDRGSNEKGATSTAVLRNEFKKMMRESRAENMRVLRHEQEERRKLEAQLRELKKGQPPGKSSLSQSMTAS